MDFQISVIYWIVKLKKLGLVFKPKNKNNVNVNQKFLKLCEQVHLLESGFGTIHIKMK